MDYRNCFDYPLYSLFSFNFYRLKRIIGIESRIPDLMKNIIPCCVDPRKKTAKNVDKDLGE